MCLYIDFDYHSDRKPKVADRPFVVKKRLRKMDSGKYLTPYQGGMVEFGVLYEDYNDFEKEIDDVIDNNNFNTVDYGHHSFRYNTIILDFIDRRYTIADRDTVWVYGVIPQGARFYIGLHQDLVSDSIVYYKTLDDLKEAYGCTKLAKPISCSSLT